MLPSFLVSFPPCFSARLLPSCFLYPPPPYPGGLRWLYWFGVQASLSPCLFPRTVFLNTSFTHHVFLPLASPPLPVGKARFDSSAKLAGWPRMRVPPYLGGSSLSFYLFAFKWKVGIALRPSNRLKYKKKKSHNRAQPEVLFSNLTWQS